MNRTIKNKLLLWNGFIVVATLLLVSALIYLILKEHLYGQVDGRLLAEVEELGRLSHYKSGTIVFSDSSEWMEHEHVELGEHAIFLQISMGDSVVLRSQNLAEWGLALSPLNDIGPHAVLSDTILQGISMRRADLYNSPLMITALQSTDEIHAFLEHILTTFLMISPFVLVLALWGTFVGVNRSLQPLKRITATARHIFDSGDLKQRITAHKADEELLQLIDTLNALFGKLESSLRQMKNFSADASHELRTPLTIMRGQIEVLLSRERPAAEYRQALESVHEEVLKMTHIINNLLQLARVDEGKEDLDMAVLRLDKVVEDFLPLARRMTEKSNLQLRHSVEDSLELLGNREALIELLTNLTDNAVKYNRDKGYVFLRGYASNGGIHLEVEDNGIGIAPEERQQIFERFYRIDKTRSRQMGGSGLGLSIVNWIVKEHKGRISIEGEPGDKTVFHVIFPRLEFE